MYMSVCICVETEHNVRHFPPQVPSTFLKTVTVFHWLGAPSAAVASWWVPGICPSRPPQYWDHKPQYLPTVLRKELRFSLLKSDGLATEPSPCTQMLEKLHSNVNLWKSQTSSGERLSKCPEVQPYCGPLLRNVLPKEKTWRNQRWEMLIYGDCGPCGDRKMMLRKRQKKKIKLASGWYKDG